MAAWYWLVWAGYGDLIPLSWIAAPVSIASSCAKAIVNEGSVCVALSMLEARKA